MKTIKGAISKCDLCEDSGEASSSDCCTATLGCSLRYQKSSVADICYCFLRFNLSFKSTRFIIWLFSPSSSKEAQLHSTSTHTPMALFYFGGSSQKTTNIWWRQALQSFVCPAFHLQVEGGDFRSPTDENRLRKLICECRPQTFSLVGITGLKHLRAQDVYFLGWDEREW